MSNAKIPNAQANLQPASIVPVDQTLMGRMRNAFRALRGNTQLADPGNEWFGPGQPLNPIPPNSPDNTARRFDYPSYSNINYHKKPLEGVPFSILHGLADNYDLLRLLIETRKGQIGRLGWTIAPRNDGEPDSRCQAITDFLQLPDKENDWQSWVGMVFEEKLVIDALTIYPRMTRGGDLYSLEVLDGSTISRVIDVGGRTPLPPDPAYQQIIKGVPMCDYTRDELIYRPSNIRARKLYGFSNVEQLVMIAQTAISRQLYQLQYYTDGTTPDLIMELPADWQLEQIKMFEDWWNSKLRGNTAQRRGTMFVPGGIKPVDTKEKALTDKFDEYLARIVCYCFGVSVQPFVSMMNRATAQTAEDQAKEEGVGPDMSWFTSVMNTIIAKYFKAPDLEFQFADADETDPAIKSKIWETQVKAGACTIDEWRDAIGLDPLEDGLGSVPLVYTAGGAMLLDDVINPPEPAQMPQMGPDGQSLEPDPNAEPPRKTEKGDFHDNQFTGGIATGRAQVVTPESASRARASAAPQANAQASAATASAQASAASGVANTTKTKAAHHKASKAHHAAAKAHHAAGNHKKSAHHKAVATHHAKKARKTKKWDASTSLTKGMAVNAEYDVPYGFGISKDGGTIYRDKDMPQILSVDGVDVDLDETCAVHEITEFSHCKDGDPYLQGHQKADEQEHALVARQGADPARYEMLLSPHLDQAMKKGETGLANTPPDIATYPYIESGEMKLLSMAKLAKKKTTNPTRRQVAALKKPIATALKSAMEHVVTSYALLGKASGNSELEDFLAGLSFVTLMAITDPFSEVTADAAESAFTDVLVEVGADSDPVFGLANTRAQQIASDRAAELIGDDGEGEMADATRLLIRGTIEDAFANGWSSSELSDQLESSYAFSEDRADVIAETEMRMAIGAGAIEGARASGAVKGKQWLLSNDADICDECQGNADQDVIDLDEDFDSGDDTVPAHPNCRCVVVFITDDGEETE